MCRCSIKIKKITYPTSLNEIADILNDNILKALENFCEDEGYWLKAYFLLGTTDEFCSIEDMDKMIYALSKNKYWTIVKRKDTILETFFGMAD